MQIPKMPLSHPKDVTTQSNGVRRKVLKSFVFILMLRSKKHMTVIIGTSGDTGSAAISALRGLEWVDTVVLLPHGRCTMIQELQMTTVLGKYISRKL